ncbi:SRPBCC family protein [Ornithinibacillus halotolerans]|uniref:SRPBCC family protein n=1 Tax=Ornithinibacillus halotolerans TaxID=1274357 RepID=A0A916S952_9BACI|nr:SRPBCC family protein [Ornithinibacillus halotolerans]GGA86945.1 hypothetical protein GCM10008025_32290 [Ornithinibacillus halotolerans]
MIQWNEQIIIPANIETVWKLFQDEQVQRIMPNVVERKPLETKEGVVGSTYIETYQEGKRQETYTGTLVEYEDTPVKKHKMTEFVLAKAFNIQNTFTLEKLDEHTTRFIYGGKNEGINFLGRALLKLGNTRNNNKVVNDFLALVKEEAVKG